MSFQRFIRLRARSMNCLAYKWRMLDIVISGLKTIILSFTLGYLFYKSVAFSIILIIPIGAIIFKREFQSHQHRFRKALLIEYKDALLALSASLNAGFSLESAIMRTEHEMIELHTHRSIIAEEFRVIGTGVKCGENVEDMFLSLGKKSGLDEIMDFGELLVVSKKKGGNINSVISRMVDSISANQQVKNEIEVMVSEKKLEGRIMIMAVPGIIMYMFLTNSSYIEPLYGNVLGIGFMTVCLVILVGMIIYTDKILNIDI